MENYIYILNVRFAGEIHFTRQADEGIMDCRVPSMILQPLVENAVNHGIRNIDWEGRIHLETVGKEDSILIRMRDNGKGMSEERIQGSAERMHGRDGEEQSDSTGVGMNNVISRLELYYNQKESGGDKQSGRKYRNGNDSDTSENRRSRNKCTESCWQTTKELCWRL